jgi:hypothetical protein
MPRPSMPRPSIGAKPGPTPSARPATARRAQRACRLSHFVAQSTIGAVPDVIATPSSVFLPEQRQRHVRPAQLPMHRSPVRHRALLSRDVRRWREQQPLQPLIVEIIRQRPAKPSAPRPADISRSQHRGSAQRCPLRLAGSTGAPIVGAALRESSASTISHPAFRSPVARQRIETTHG